MISPEKIAEMLTGIDRLRLYAHDDDTFGLAIEDAEAAITEHDALLSELLTLRAERDEARKGPPREPTREMMDAGLYQASHDSTHADVYSIWVDMWEAATSPTTNPEPAQSDPAAIARVDWKARALAAEAQLARQGGVLKALVNAEALSGVRAVVAGWNGENSPVGPFPRHPSALGATLPKTTCGAVYALDEAMQAARSTLSTEDSQPSLPQDVIDLVIEARTVAYSDQSPEAIQALDKAVEAFSERVGWDDEPIDPEDSHG